MSNISHCFVIKMCKIYFSEIYFLVYVFVGFFFLVYDIGCRYEALGSLVLVPTMWPHTGRRLSLSPAGVTRVHYLAQLSGIPAYGAKPRTSCSYSIIT